jgi:SHS2 domain-containing protein
MKYRFLEHTADIKFQSFGETLEEAFENSALAMFYVMVDIEKVKKNKKIKVECFANNIEELLIEWLNKLLAKANINEMVFSEFMVRIKNNKLEGQAFGEKLDIKKHNPKIEVKAATYSELFVKKEKDKFICQVVLDV